jgi:hypothetical protein
MTQRINDVNGWFSVPRNPISRAGVFPYLKSSIKFPGWENDPQGIVHVFRPPEELADPAVAESFKLAPWIDNHTMLGNPEAEPGLTAPEEKGVQGTLGEQVQYDPSDRTLYANLKVWSKSLADKINAGKKELSLGFRCVYEFAAGVFEGQPFQAIQRTIRGNHIASVEHGRMGPGVAVLDHFEFAFDANDLVGGIPMAKKVTHRHNVAKVLGIAMDQVDTVLGFDPAKNTEYAAAMDAEEDEKDAPEATGGDMSLSAIADMLADVGPALGKINDALAAMAGGATASPDEDVLDDDMEPVLDANGAPTMDAAGKPIMQKKAAATPVTDATMAACDAAILAAEGQSKRAHAALKGRAAPPVLAAMDAAITTAKTTRAKIKPRTNRNKGTGMDSKIAALEGAVKVLTGADHTRAAMTEIANRDRLANKVSAFVGTFDHAEMTTVDVAKYAAGKFGLKPAAGAEVSAVEAYLHDRQPATAAPAAKAYGMDAAAVPPVPAKKVADYIG